MGKSSLFNRLAGRMLSIVADRPGVTRDRLSAPVALGDGEKARYVELIDTGGMGIEDSDNLTDDVEFQIRSGIDMSDVIIFLVDAREGIVPLDSLVAQKLRRSNKPVIFAANKVDEANLTSEIGEMGRLGFGEPIALSATHGRGVRDLLDRIERELKDVPPVRPAEAVMQLAIVGKRNAGKSTLINALCGEKRVIVSEVPGTTRDSVDVRLCFNGKEILLIDTAGVKRKKKLADEIEFYSQHRALRSVRRADVTAMVIDASVPVSQIDKDLAGTIAAEFKPVLIVVNKWDLAKNAASTDDYAEYFGKTFPELSFAPIIFTTATQGMNVKTVLDISSELCAQSRHRVTTGQLNAAIEAITSKRGPSHKTGTKPPKIFYSSQIDIEPPTIVMFVNDARSFDKVYQRFLVGRLREYLAFSEVPIRLMLRGKETYRAYMDKKNRPRE